MSSLGSFLSFAAKCAKVSPQPEADTDFKGDDGG